MKPASTLDGFTIRSRGDMVLIGKAIRLNWELDQSTRNSIVQQLESIIANDSRQRWVIRATETLVLMKRQNGAATI